VSRVSSPPAGARTGRLFSSHTLRTTLKRGLGKTGTNGNGDGKAVFPPGVITPMARYRQPPPLRSGRLLRILGWGFASILMLVCGIAGGAYLFFHHEVANVQAHTPAIKIAAKKLAVPLPGHPTVALVIGYDHRAADGNAPSRSDTVMLLRADPQTKSLSLLSFPRDLVVDRICPGHPTVQDRINSAYAVCGPKGTLETVKKLTGLPINYLISVNFHGFTDIVNKVGGVWMDIDRRYYNKNVGTAGTNFANIDLHPGYQRLTGEQALDFVRYRHTDSDIYRTARQQLFLAALKLQVRRTFSPFGLPGLIDTITRNVEVGAGGGTIQGNTILSYALFAYGLPPGHIFRTQIAGLQSYGFANAELVTAPANIQKAVQDFTNPDAAAPAKATASALGVKPKQVQAPPVAQTTLLVLNGNGVTGSASNLGYLLGQRGYRVVVPPSGLPANAPSFDYFHSKVYYRRGQAGAKAAARVVRNLLGEADVAALPAAVHSYGALVTVVVGSTFHGSIAPPLVDSTPQHVPPSVAPAPSSVNELAKAAQRQLPFKVEVPWVLEHTSVSDYEEPNRVYPLGGAHYAVRFVFRTGQSEYWGVEETNWDGAPIISGPNQTRRLGGRTFRLYYSGSHLTMVVLKQNGASYWVVNTLLDSLSNETMLSIAKGLRTYGK
jgi:LCP family protein required for cell wall assembly